MGVRKDSSLSQTYKVARAKEVLKLSENKLIDVLSGKTGLPEREVVKVALELYKRRIPSKVETASSGSQITMVKIVKNHLPNQKGFAQEEIETIDMKNLDDQLNMVIDSKVNDINEKIQANKGIRYTGDNYSKIKKELEDG